MRPTDSHDLLLLAAARLGPEFSLEELVIKAWQHAPLRFGMKGHPEYPDTHRVACYLSGKRGLVGLGKLERTGPNRLRLRRPKPRIDLTPTPNEDRRYETMQRLEKIKTDKNGLCRHGLRPDECHTCLNK